MNYNLVCQAVFFLALSRAVFGIGDDARLDGKPLTLGGGGLTTTSEGTAGMVFAISETRLHLKDFSFGTGSSVPTGVQFILGSTLYDNSTIVKILSDSDYKVVPDEVGSIAALKKYENKELFLTLSSGDSINNFKYFALYSTTTNTFYGVVEIAASWTAPMPIVIGRFSALAHGVSSGDVTVLDTKTIKIQGFNYDGAGPDAFFYIGDSDTVQHQSAPLGKIPDEQGILSKKAAAYSNKDIVLKLPDQVTVYDIKWLSMWCIAAVVNFGDIRFDSALTADKYVPVVTELDIDAGDMNCEQLSDKMQVYWEKDEQDNINFRLVGKINRDQYMAFGLSGKEDQHWMIDADVVVGGYPEGGPVNVVDYKLTGRAQCAGGSGVCPDTQLSTPGTNNVMMAYGSFTDGVTSISYTRQAQTSDPNDKEYKLDGTAQQIVWGIGPFNTKGTAAIHTEVIRESKTIDFARTTASNCEPFAIGGVVVEKPDFKPHHLYGDDTDVFTAEIGLSGSEQGYTAITGSPSWGIAWYINGTLVPELHLIIGREYTFRVAGGENETIKPQYHPFYITDNPRGGYGDLTNQTVKNAQTIYPGKVDGSTSQFAVGDYCEWESTDEYTRLQTGNHVWRCFEEFKSYLALKCLKGTKYTEFKWTPTANHPKTVYYQCFTHENLGWKIHLYSEADFPTTKIKTEVCLRTEVQKTEVHQKSGAADSRSFAAVSLILVSILHFFI